MKRRKEALAEARESIRLAPELPNAMYTLASALKENRQMDEAKLVANRLLAAAPETTLPHNILALIALRERRWRDAESHSRKALERDTGSWPDLNNLGLSLRFQGRKKEAIEILHRAAKANPGADLVRKNLHGSVMAHCSALAWSVFA